MSAKTPTGSGAPPASFKILYFAAARSYSDKESESLPAPLELGKLFELLEQSYAGIKEKVLCYCKVSINWEYVDMDEDLERVINPGDEVGIIPPVSSG